MVNWLVTSILPVLLASGSGAESSASEVARPRAAVLVRASGAGSDKAATFAGYYWRHFVEQDLRYESVPLIKVLGSRGYARALEDFRSASELVTRGRHWYQEFELDQTVSLLTEAVAYYERNAAYLSDFPELADLLMLLGAVHSLRGEESLGSEFFGQAYAAYVDVEPDPALFNPLMREQFTQAVEGLNNRPRGSLALTSNPSYAEVYIDGDFVGVTPMVLEGLLAGPHYLKLGKSGFGNWGKVVRIEEGSESAETIRLEPTDHYDQFDRLLEAGGEDLEDLMEVGSTRLPRDKEVPGRVEELGALLNADHIFWAEVQLDGDQIRIVGTQIDLNGVSREKKWVQTGVTVFSYNSNPDKYRIELGRFYASTFSAGGLASRAAAGVSEPEAASGVAHFGGELCFGVDCGVYKNVVLGAGLGAGVLSMGVGALFWTKAVGNNDEYRGKSGVQPAQTSSRAQDLRASGEAQAFLGDLCFSLGAVLSVGTVVWSYLFDPAPGADDVVGESSGGWGIGFEPVREGGLLTGQVRF